MIDSYIKWLADRKAPSRGTISLHREYSVVFVAKCEKQKSIIQLVIFITAKTTWIQLFLSYKRITV